MANPVTTPAGDPGLAGVFSDEVTRAGLDLITPESLSNTLTAINGLGQLVSPNDSRLGDPFGSENLTGQVSNPFALDSQGGTLLAGASGGVLATGLTATATGQTALQAILETGFLPSAGSTLAIAVGALVPENLFESGTEFRIDSKSTRDHSTGRVVGEFRTAPC